MYVCSEVGLPCDHYPGCHWPVTRHLEDPPPPPDLFKLVYLGPPPGPGSAPYHMDTWVPPIGAGPHAFYMRTIPAPPFIHPYSYWQAGSWPLSERTSCLLNVLVTLAVYNLRIYLSLPVPMSKFGFLPQNFGRWSGPTNGTLSLPPANKVAGR